VRSTIWLIAVVSLLCFSGPGCNKNAGTAKTAEEASFQLRLALDKASPEVKRLYFDKVDPAVRYDKYPEALAALDQMANDPSVKPDQKKLITQLANMLKAKAPSP
jgi:hypothetical protein